MITNVRSPQKTGFIDDPSFARIAKADLPADTFERAPAPDPDAPLAAGEARAVAGKTRLEGTSFEPRAAVWLADKDGYIDIVLSDEADLAEQLRRHTRSPLAHRFYMYAEPARWGRPASTLHGHTGFFQFPQELSDEYFRAQMYIPGKLRLDLNASDESTLLGHYSARSLNDPSRGKVSGDFAATHLDLSGDPEQAATVRAFCIGWNRRGIRTLTKSLTHDFVSVARSNASVTRAIAAMQVGPAACDDALPAEGLSFFAAQHALNALGWQALARVCSFYDIGSEEVALPSADALAGKWIWSKRRALREAREQVLAIIAQRHGGTDLALHFSDAKGPHSAHRELYLSYKNQHKETKWVVPGLLRRTITTGPDDVLCVPIMGESQEDDGPILDSLAGEGTTFAERGNGTFVRDGAGRFSPRAASPNADGSAPHTPAVF